MSQQSVCNLDLLVSRAQTLLSLLGLVQLKAFARIFAIRFQQPNSITAYMLAKFSQLATINIFLTDAVADRVLLITKLHEMMFFPKDVCIGRGKRHIKRACIPFQILSGMSCTRDAALCLGFFDMLAVDLLLLTAERWGQPGLTRTNPVGHLEPPRRTAQRDYLTHSNTRCCTHIRGH